MQLKPVEDIDSLIGHNPVRAKPEMVTHAKENYGSQTLPKTQNGGLKDDNLFEAPFYLSGVFSYDSTAHKIDTAENNF